MFVCITTAVQNSNVDDVKRRKHVQCRSVHRAGLRIWSHRRLRRSPHRLSPLPPPPHKRPLPPPLPCVSEPPHRSHLEVYVDNVMQCQHLVRRRRHLRRIRRLQFRLYIAP